MKSGFQFGVIRLLVFTTLAGLVLAWMVRIRWNFIGVIYLGVYLLLMVAWGTFRGPWIWNELQRIRRERKSRQLAVMLDLEKRRMENQNREGK